MKLKHLIVIEVAVILIFLVSLVASQAASAAPRSAPYGVSQSTSTPRINRALLRHRHCQALRRLALVRNVRWAARLYIRNNCGGGGRYGRPATRR